VPQPSKGTIHIDVDELETLIHHLKKLRDSLHDQKYNIPMLQHGLDHAISGTAANIEKFDQSFDHWMKLLDSVTMDMDIAYHTLQIVLEGAQKGHIAAESAPLGKGSKEHHGSP